MWDIFSMFLYKVTKSNNTEYIWDREPHLTESLLNEIRNRSVADEISCRRHRFQNASIMFVTTKTVTANKPADLNTTVSAV